MDVDGRGRGDDGGSAPTFSRRGLARGSARPATVADERLGLHLRPWISDRDGRSCCCCCRWTMKEALIPMHVAAACCVCLVVDTVVGFSLCFVGSRGRRKRRS
uniref:Predicted protein n=1 Tax=Hordeum vulgare subsp. vulgare TaxID=112509 RepID=F2D8M3_HORVV|nr:predicted protein [Hordeum vulgare subsp. vulgare]